MIGRGCTAEAELASQLQPGQAVKEWNHPRPAGCSFALSAYQNSCKRQWGHLMVRIIHTKAATFTTFAEITRTANVSSDCLPNQPLRHP